MRIKRSIAGSMAVLLTVWALLLSPALDVQAASSDLYGTGSADEINIIKLLDMALNKGGMSMSPSTIRSFIEFWWDSVQADLSTCAGNADSAITTTQAFVDYLYTALESAEHYDKLGSTIKKYVQYVVTLEYKSLSDFKQLLLQPDTFRQFLLSYVTDEDGNIAGTVNNRLKKYNIKSDMVNMVRKAADAYIEEYEGYYLVPTYTYKDLSPTLFQTKTLYDQLVTILKKADDKTVYLAAVNSTSIHSLNGIDLVLYKKSDYNTSMGIIPYFEVTMYNDNWDSISSLYKWSTSEDEDIELFPQEKEGQRSSYYYSRISFYAGLDLPFSSVHSFLATSDGRSVKVWKSLDAFKQASVGRSNVYYSSGYSGYDPSVDNSVEFSGSYYSSNSSSYSHDVIQNTIDNSSEVNESMVNNIVNNYINNYYTDSSGGGSGDGSGGSSSSGSGSGDWWNLGDGITALIEGIAKLLDFLLKLLGDLIGLIGGFLVDLLSVLESLAVIGSSFGDFITAFFGFLPEECVAMIIAGIGLLVVVGVIKMFKK